MISYQAPSPPNPSPSFNCCAKVFVYFGVKPSLEDASCKSKEFE